MLSRNILLQNLSISWKLKPCLGNLNRGLIYQIRACSSNAPNKPEHFKIENSKAPPRVEEGKSPIKLEHFKIEETREKDYLLPHPIWNEEELHSIQIKHTPPVGFVENYAYYSVALLRIGFDIFSGYKFGKMNENKWLLRIIFLETIAAVPGMMGAMVRHLNSLRKMKRDFGWIHTLLEEAENERMHLLVSMELFHPSYFHRMLVLLAQGIFVNMFFFTYLVSSRYCHSFVGYLEEEAVKTYTNVIKHIDEPDGTLKEWRTKPAPKIAIKYWKLNENATLRDVFLAIRADEAHHRDVNHTLAKLKNEENNPYGPGR